MTNLISTIQAWMVARKDDDRGATMVEYGLMVALIAIVALGAVEVLGGGVSATFQEIADAITGAGGGGD